MDIRQFDYKEGDIVQITKGKYTGKVGEIIGSRLSENEKFFVYVVKLSDRSSCTATDNTMQMVRAYE